MKESNTVLACFGLILIAAVGIVGGAVMNGYVLSVLWAWFVSPLFNAPQLSVTTAIGISLVVGMLVSHDATSTGEKKDTTDAIANIISRALLSPLITLFVGWVVKLFI